MNRKRTLGTIVLSGIAVAAAASFLAAPAHSADQPQAGATPDAHNGYVLVDRAELQKMVHDEVARQIQDFIARAREEQHKQMQLSSAAARYRAMISTVQTLRSQIALYRLQHHDDSPTLGQMSVGFHQLLLQTDSGGNPAIPGGNQAFGPYMQSSPPNPFTGRTKVVAAGKPTPDAGWTYDPSTGMVKAVLPRQLQDKLNDADAAHYIEFAASE